MAWVKFTADFDFSPGDLGGLVTIAYKAGTVENVTSDCAALAVAAKKAVPAKNPRGGAIAGGDDSSSGAAA